MPVQIPRNAIADESDIGPPVRNLLQDLNLMGADENAGTGFVSAFTGPPQSVALIEAGATAAAKWWSAGLGAALVVLWANVIGWWNGGLAIEMKLAVIGGVALVTAALVVSIAHLLASDVRGRADAAVATIQARARLAENMIAAVEAATPAPQIIPLHGLLQFGMVARNHDRPANEDGWIPVAMERLPNGDINYVLQKGVDEMTVPAARVEFHA